MAMFFFYVGNQPCCFCLPCDAPTACLCCLTGDGTLGAGVAPATATATAAAAAAAAAPAPVAAPKTCLVMMQHGRRNGRNGDGWKLKPEMKPVRPVGDDILARREDLPGEKSQAESSKTRRTHERERGGRRDGVGEKER